MIRWIFAALLLANLFPPLMAVNQSAQSSSTLAVASDSGGSAGGRAIELLAEVRSLPELGAPVDEQNQPLPQRREQSCFMVGPLASMAVAETIAEHLEESGLALEKRWREVEGGMDYWVHLPPQPSMRATTRVLQELKANNIDSFVFAEGELDGAIALGVYSDQAAAEAQRAHFQELGYEAEVYSMQRWLREYWLLSDRIPGAAVLDALDQTSAGRGSPQNISPKSCLAVASTMQFQ